MSVIYQYNTRDLDQSQINFLLEIALDKQLSWSVEHQFYNSDQRRRGISLSFHFVRELFRNSKSVSVELNDNQGYHLVEMTFSKAVTDTEIYFLNVAIESPKAVRITEMLTPF